MYVPDSTLFQRDRELILAEMRMPARLRDRTDVDELLYAMRFKRFEKLLDGERGVADGVNGQGFTTARRYERIVESSVSV